MEKILKRIENSEWVKSTLIRCARTFLTTVLGVWTVGTQITEINWKATLLSAVSTTAYIFLICLLGGLPEVKENENQ